MKNYKQPGVKLKFTAPGSGVVSGEGYIIGATLVVASSDADAGDEFTGRTEGVFEMTKVNGLVVGEGDLMFWDDAAKQWEASASGDYPAGTGTEDAISAALKVNVKLHGHAVVVVA